MAPAVGRWGEGGGGGGDDGAGGAGRVEETGCAYGALRSEERHWCGACGDGGRWRKFVGWDGDGWGSWDEVPGIDRLADESAVFKRGVRGA